MPLLDALREAVERYHTLGIIPEPRPPVTLDGLVCPICDAVFVDHEGRCLESK